MKPGDWNTGRFGYSKSRRKLKSKGTPETVEAWLAAGNKITQCPPATVGVIQWRQGAGSMRKPSRLFS